MTSYGKLQLENCSAAYHIGPLHTSFNSLVARRRTGESKHASVDALDFNQFIDSGAPAGSFTFPHGHTLYWGENPAPASRPAYALKDEIEARVGAERAKWMFHIRQLTVFPTLQIAETASLQLRT